MASSRPDAFADDLSIMKALLQEFSKKEELELIAGIENDVSEVHQACGAREAEVKAVIRGADRAALQHARASPRAIGAVVRAGRARRACGDGRASNLPLCRAELSRQVEESQAKSAYPYAEDAHQQLVAQLQATLRDASAAIEQLMAGTR